MSKATTELATKIVEKFAEYEQIDNGAQLVRVPIIGHQAAYFKTEKQDVVGNETYHAKAGDFIYIPAGVSHYYEACYGSEYEFLCMITTKEDKITML